MNLVLAKGRSNGIAIAVSSSEIGLFFYTVNELHIQHSRCQWISV